VTVTLDLLTLKLMRIIATLLPILVSLRLFVLDLWANTCQMDHVTYDLDL